MNAPATVTRYADLIRGDHVHGSLYTDPAIFEEELRKIWYRTWVYVGHESEVPKAHDFVMKSIGPQPVIMTRDAAGKVRHVGRKPRCLLLASEISHGLPVELRKSG